MLEHICELFLLAHRLVHRDVFAEPFQNKFQSNRFFYGFFHHWPGPAWCDIEKSGYFWGDVVVSKTSWAM